MLSAALLQPVTDLLDLGGPVVVLIALMSVVALAIILLKLVQYGTCRTARPGRARLAARLWRQGRKREAASLLDQPAGAVEEAVANAMHLSLAGGMDRSDIETEIARIATARLHGLQGGFKALDAIAQLAPLLGLFGTVIGMIEAFQSLQSAGSSVDPSLLAGGIWVALLTTAAGLAVAMPVSAILSMFESWVESERVAIETICAEILVALPGTPGLSHQTASVAPVAVGQAPAVAIRASHAH